MNDELDLESLESVTGGKKFLTREEEARVYQNFSGDNAKKMVDLLNQKKLLRKLNNKKQVKNYLEEERFSRKLNYLVEFSFILFYFSSNI